MTEYSNLISVIIPIYNVEEYLEQCVTSVLKQTHHNLEIILVDNGSTDGCPEICDMFATMDSRVKVIHHPNAGLVGARKTGLAASTGRYIACLDGDDWIDPTMYDVLFSEMMRTNADIVVAGHVENLLGKTEFMYNAVPAGVYSGENLENLVYRNMLCNGKFSQFGIYSYHWNKLFKRNVIYDNQMNVDSRIFIGEDAACVYPALLAADTVCVVDCCLHHYRQRANSMVKTTESYSQEFECISVLYNYLRDIFSKSKYSEYLLPQLRLYILSLMTVRSDCLLPKNENLPSLFPFSKVKPGSSVVLFGAGTFGQHLYRRLQANNNFELISWVDVNYEEYQQFNLPVNDINTIHLHDFDYVLVAYIDETVAKDASNLLVSMGIDSDKIAWIEYNLDETESLLKIYGI